MTLRFEILNATIIAGSVQLNADTLTSCVILYRYIDYRWEVWQVHLSYNWAREESITASVTARGVQLNADPFLSCVILDSQIVVTLRVINLGNGQLQLVKQRVFLLKYHG